MSFVADHSERMRKVTKKEIQPPANIDAHLDFERELRNVLSRWGIFPAVSQIETLFAHYLSMLEANRSMNLTRITDPIDAAILHYADSLSVLSWANARTIDFDEVLDVGSGAGFPAFPLAVMRPTGTVTALEATRKKADFLGRVVNESGVVNLRVVNEHSEHWRPGRTYSLVVFRATAKMSLALSQTVDLIAPRGRIVAYQSASSPSCSATSALSDSRLGLNLEERFSYELPLRSEVIERTLIVFRKEDRRAHSG